jgi:hypothetical protein
VLEDDIAIGAMLAFHIGNHVQSDTARSFKWCPVSGEYGHSRCGVAAITAAHTRAGLSRRKLTMGTQCAGRRTWIMRDPKEGTIRRMVALLSGKTGDRTSLLARLRTTPWSRKKQTMVRKGQPKVSSDAIEEDASLAGQPRAEQGGGEPSAASQRSQSEPWVFCVNWQKTWETSLGRVATNGHRSPGSLREVNSAWLREQGDWNGSRATGEGWVLLEGRACEIARARAQLDLQQAHKQGTVNDYLQSLRQRGHVELAHAGLTMLNLENTSTWEKDRRQHQDQVNVWMAWLDWEVRFVRPSWEANVTTWNLGPLGYEYSRSQLQQLLTKGQQPEYYCFL